MEYLAAAKTDIGNTRAANEDSILLKAAAAGDSRCLLAAVFDGMGGLSDGEYASRSAARAFEGWFLSEFPAWAAAGFSQPALQAEWMRVLRAVNTELVDYGLRRRQRCGTTATVLLLTPQRYFIAHVGDTRVYEVSTALRQLTADHTLAAREVAAGRLRPEEAEDAPESSVLTRCIGATEDVTPDFLSGTVLPEAVYLLCSDGFRHKLTGGELLAGFSPAAVRDTAGLSAACEGLTALAMQRREADNLSVVAVRTCGQVQLSGLPHTSTVSLRPGTGRRP